MRTIRQRFSLDSGRVSMISTMSPTRVSLVSSCAWQTVRRFWYLPYLGCGTRRSTSTRRVLSILSLATTPISVWRRPRAWPGAIAGCWSGLGSWRRSRVFRLPLRSVGIEKDRWGCCGSVRPCVRQGLATQRIHKFRLVAAWASRSTWIARSRWMVLIRAISRLALMISLGRFQPFGLALEAKAEQVLLGFTERGVRAVRRSARAARRAYSSWGPLVGSGVW